MPRIKTEDYAMKVKLLKPVAGLPYKLGDIVPVYRTYKNKIIWHVWTMIVTLPEDSYERVSEQDSL